MRLAGTLAVRGLPQALQGWHWHGARKFQRGWEQAGGGNGFMEGESLSLHSHMGGARIELKEVLLSSS